MAEILKGTTKLPLSERKTFQAESLTIAYGPKTVLILPGVVPSNQFLNFQMLRAENRDSGVSIRLGSYVSYRLGKNILEYYGNVETITFLEGKSLEEAVRDGIFWKKVFPFFKKEISRQASPKSGEILVPTREKETLYFLPSFAYGESGEFLPGYMAIFKKSEKKQSDKGNYRVALV